MKRVFSNLLINAVLHNPVGTSIIVCIKGNSHAEVKVTDNGIGMDKQSISHLFERYHRGTSTATPSGGTGLGMNRLLPYMRERLT